MGIICPAPIHLLIFAKVMSTMLVGQQYLHFIDEVTKPQRRESQDFNRGPLTQTCTMSHCLCPQVLQEKLLWSCWQVTESGFALHGDCGFYNIDTHTENSWILFCFFLKNKTLNYISNFIFSKYKSGFLVRNFIEYGTQWMHTQEEILKSLFTNPLDLKIASRSIRT